MKVLLFHPEGNLNYNANLLGILRLFGQAGLQVTYVTERRPALDQTTQWPGLTIMLVEPQETGIPRFLSERQPLLDLATAEDFAPFAGHDLVLGIDRGILEAAEVARFHGVQHALLSYEIMFKEETSAVFKDVEIAACRDLAFAVCQDSLRSRKLSLEYHIPPERILQAPAAGIGFRDPRPKPRFLHQQFDLPEETRTVIHIGSFADWTHAAYLLTSTQHWPEDWKLVIHQRYGASEATRDLIRRHAHPERVCVSETTFKTCDDMRFFIQSADLGIALYKPTYVNRWTGRNIEYIGLSSGKINSYLQHGLPVATHELGEITDWIRYYGAGQIFSLDGPFVPVTPDDNCVDATRQVFDHHLDLQRFGQTILKSVRSAARPPRDQRTRAPRR